MKFKFSRPTPTTTTNNFSPGDYIMQQKYDGHRIVLDFSKNGFKAITRNKKDIAEYLPHLDLKQKLRDCVLDCELIHDDGLYHINKLLSLPVNKSKMIQRKGRLNVVVFDILQYQGRDVRTMEYLERLRLLDLIFLRLSKNTNFKKITTYFADFNTHLKNFNFIGMEGAVFKKVKGNYFSDSFKFKFKKDFSYIVSDLTVRDNKLISIELSYIAYNELTIAGKVRSNEISTRLFKEGRIKIGDIVDIEALELTENLAPRDGLLKCLRPDLNKNSITRSSLLKSA